MEFKNIIPSFVLFALLWSVSAISAPAQEPNDPTSTKPAAKAIPPFPDVLNSQEDTAGQDLTKGLQADTTPLTGVQTATLGAQQLEHSYWVPGFQYANTIQSSGVSSGSWYSSNYFLGNLSLVQNWSRSTLALNYTGGGYVSTNSAQRGGAYQQLNLAQSFHLKRWDLEFLDQFAYLPESSFGFGAGTNLGAPGVGGSVGVSLPGISGSLVPNQSILSSVGPRYTNAFAVQSTYEMSARDSLTMSASYGILNFTEPGNIDSQMPTASFGYNRALTKENTIGLVYRFAAYHYTGNPQAIGDQVVSLAYGRKITGRLALQLYGGPEITSYRVPVDNTSQRVSGYGSASLSYALGPTTGMALSYLHGLSAGSGVLLGSQLDQVNFNAYKTLGRVWTAQFNFGFARNKPITNSSSTPAQDFNNWFISAGFTRPIGRNMNLSIAYNAQIERAGITPCTTSNCTATSTQNIVNLSFQWHTRPLVLR